MAAPTQPAPLTKIIDCIAQRLTHLTNDGGYRTNGVVIDRAKDPRIIKQNKAAEYAKKNRLISIYNGIGKTIPSESIGKVERWKQIIELHCLVSITKEDDVAGIDLGVIEANLKTDLTWIFRRDSGLKTSARELHALYPAKGYDQMNCTKCLVSDFLAGEQVSFPDATFVMPLMVEYDEFDSKISL